MYILYTGRIENSKNYRSNYNMKSILVTPNIISLKYFNDKYFVLRLKLGYNLIV